MGGGGGGGEGEEGEGEEEEEEEITGQTIPSSGVDLLLSRPEAFFLFLLFPVFDFPPGSLLRDLHHKTTQVFTQQAGCLHNKHTGNCSTHPAAEPRTGTAMASSSVPSFLADVSREGKSDWVGKEVLRLNF